ncbi:hypothetical protein V8C86DRAFT_2562831, partial [Haematococcus lacustris]
PQAVALLAPSLPLALALAAAPWLSCGPWCCATWRACCRTAKLGRRCSCTALHCRRLVGLRTWCCGPVWPTLPLVPGS